MDWNLFNPNVIFFGLILIGFLWIIDSMKIHRIENVNHSQFTNNAVFINYGKKETNNKTQP